MKHRTEDSKVRKPKRTPIEHLQEMLIAGGLSVETGDVGDGEGAWLKATAPGPTAASLPHDSCGDRVKGASSVEFCFAPDGRAVVGITVSRDVWERTDSEVSLRLDGRK